MGRDAAYRASRCNGEPVSDSRGGGVNGWSIGGSEMKYVRRAISGILQLTVLLVFAGVGDSALASAPQCYSYSGGGWYCQYTGLVSQAYVNSGDSIILYFDAPVAPGSLSAVGATGVTVYSSALYVATT